LRKKLITAEGAEECRRGRGEKLNGEDRKEEPQRSQRNAFRATSLIRYVQTFV